MLKGLKRRVFGTLTADGYRIWRGSKIWVRSNILDPKRPPTQHVVGEIMEHKLKYKQPDEDGYIGAKLTSVFKKKENAYHSDSSC